MAFLTIGGVAMPTPTDYSVGIADISKAQRNANGTMIIERITTKRTLKVTWSYISKDDAFKLLYAVAKTSFRVEFPDPQYGTTIASNFYCGDRNIGMIDYINGIARYKDLQFDLIEL
jgi:hypothetical protein